MTFALWLLRRALCVLGSCRVYPVRVDDAWGEFCPVCRKTWVRGREVRNG